MNRIVALLVGLALAVAALTDVATAQETTDPASPTGHTSVDGQIVVANEANPSVEGGGADLNFGDVNSGGVTGGTTTYAETPPPDPGAAPADPDADDGGVPEVDPVAPPAESAAPPAEPAPPADSGTTEPPPSDTANEDGATTATDGLPASTTTCEGYSEWLEAQLAFEATTDPAVEASLDDDADGIACEHMMLTA